jgi:CRISPR-associated protein Cmr4
LPKPASDRIVLIDDKLFSQVVNSNLEVRTSVSINPKTGAAEDGALFTYEAIPRATFLWIDIVEDDYRDQILWKNGGVIYKAYKEETREGSDGPLRIICRDNDPRSSPLYPDPNDPLKSEQINGCSKSWQSPIDVVTAGLEWAEHLGIGGMGTRGFGRIRTLIKCKVDKQASTLKERPPLKDTNKE